MSENSNSNSESKSHLKLDIDIINSNYPNPNNKSNTEELLTKSSNNFNNNTPLSSSKYISANFPQNNSIYNSTNKTQSSTAINQKLSKNKKFSSFKMVEKLKYNNKKALNIYETEQKKGDDESITARERRDAFGNIIKKKNRKNIKVSFIDEINEEQPLVNVIDIESYKNFNIILGMSKEENINDKITNNCQCCNIL